MDIPLLLLKKIIIRTSFKNSLFFFVFFLFAFWTGELTAQKHIAIDSKGTLKEITSSQVSTTVGVTPLNPNEGDVWIDTASNTVKIWEESAVPAWSEVASIRNWISLSNSGAYGIDHLVSYNGSIYKNLTGTNSDTTPNLDVTNWKSIGGGDIVPLWKSTTSGGSYATNDIINYNGTLYKNTTGTNSDTTPDLDTTNWINLEQITKVSGEFIREGDLIKAVGLESVTGGTVVFVEGTDPTLSNIELAFDGDNETFANLYISSFSRHNYELPSVLNVSKVELNYSSPADSSNVIIRLLDATDTILEEITPPELLASQGTVKLKYEMNVSGVAKVQIFDPTGSRTNINEISLYTLENSLAIPNVDIGDTLYLEDYGYTTLLSNLDGNVTLRATSSNEVPRWVSNTNGGTYNTESIINHQGTLYKNLTGTNLDTTPDADATNWESISGLAPQAEYGKFRRITPQTSMSVNSVFTFDNVEAVSSLTHSHTTGQFTLKKGVTYKLTGSMGSSSSNQIRGSARFYDETNSTWIGTQGNTIAPADSAGWSLNTGEANTLITPSTDIVVSFRIYSISGTADFGHELGGDGQGGWPWVIVEAIAGQLPISYEAPEDAVPLWKSSTNGGSYATNDLVNYSGVLYKNTTGTNSTTTPDADTTNWEATGGGDVVPLWKSNTNGGSYATNDIINYNGTLYKNLTGTNSDTTPDADATNWEIASSSGGAGLPKQYLVAKHNSLSFSVTSGMVYPYDTTVASEGNDIVNNGNGKYTLKAGNTYKLTANIGRFLGEGYVAWKWYDDTADSYIDTGSSAQQWGEDYAAANNSWTDIGIAFAIVRPDIDTTVYLKQSSGNTPAQMYTNYSYSTARMYIEVLETSRIGGTGLAVYDSGDDYLLNDTVIKDGVIYQANGAVPAGTTFAEGTTGATWKKVGEGDTVPIWKSNTSGGSYATNDIINYNGVLYKNLTGTNTDSTPNSDTTNWAASEKSVHYVSATRIESIGGDTTETGTGIYRWDVTNGYGSVGFTVSNNNERFTPDRAGLYSVILTGRGGDHDRYPQLRIRMNGTRISGADGTRNDFAPHGSITTHWIGYLSTTDYIDAEILHGWTAGASAQISILGL